VGEYRRQLVEAIVETKEDLLTRYLEGQELSYEELRDALHAAVREGQVVPVIATSSSRKVGFAGLLHTIVEISNTAGSYPLVVVARSNGTACTVKLYEEDSADVTVGTTDAVLSVGVSATSGEISAAALFGKGPVTLANATDIDGLSIAAPATDVGTGTVANDPDVWVLYAAG